ncbi:hypothetical protein RF11_07755 [Thelohanellus kitauei]|uniref:Uncharacterized protein n=1 Tax=Thelohanellus kitauei TaxID=669202 RepID=A0A0C2MI66_THEKT|nr:hypothetical protein RF11_07755 [Thelohanellus kitauei]
MTRKPFLKTYVTFATICDIQNIELNTLLTVKISKKNSSKQLVKSHTFEKLKKTIKRAKNTTSRIHDLNNLLPKYLSDVILSATERLFNISKDGDTNENIYYANKIVGKVNRIAHDLFDDDFINDVSIRVDLIRVYYSNVDQFIIR